MASSDYDIVVVGAGLVGSVVALWLAKHTDYRIAIIEQGAPLQKVESANQRVVALGQLAVDLLTEVGVFSDLGEGHAYPYQRMCVWDENSNGELDFYAEDINSEHLGFMVDALQCNALLHAKVASSRDISSYFNCQIEDLRFDDNLAEVVFGDGTSLQATLLVAADGRRSMVRQKSKIFANHHLYQQQGIVARISTERPHQNCAWQRFLSTGPVAVLPLNNNESSIVWSVDTSTSEALMSLSEDLFCRSLSEALDFRLGNVSLLSNRQTFALSSLRAERYYRRNVVLLGDAAHAIHPLAGQGANLGFKDALCLGQLLQSAKGSVSSAKGSADGSDIGEPRLLARFERMRKPDNEQIDAFMTVLNSIYQHDSALSTVVRGLGMNLISQKKTLRALIASQAMGGN